MSKTSRGTGRAAMAGTSVSSARLGDYSRTIVLTEDDSKQDTYVLTTEVTDIYPISAQEFSLTFQGHEDEIGPLNLVISSPGVTAMAGSETNGWSSNGTNSYFHDGYAANIDISFTAENAEIIIVGTVPTGTESNL